MGKNDHARLPSVNKNMLEKGNWQAFTAVIKYIEDLPVCAATTKEKGDDDKKYNLLWLLPRNRAGEGGRGAIDMNNFPLLDAEAHRNCHAKLYEQLYFTIIIIFFLYWWLSYNKLFYLSLQLEQPRSRTLCPISHHGL